MSKVGGISLLSFNTNVNIEGEVEGRKLPLDAEARAVLVRMADGDGRASLTLAEEIWRAARKEEVFNS
ncbi:MAG TPA: hypothetical protein V6C57_06915, partial [Coleofasciculaceae cyanobacterium]